MSSYAEMSEERQAIYDACEDIMEAESKAVNYAVNYAAELRRMLKTDAVDNAIHMQCLYVLNNIQHWRGDVAKSVRTALKDFVEAK